MSPYNPTTAKPHDAGRNLATASSGATLDQILAIQSLVAGETPRWSPDGDRIMFISALGGAPDLWSVGPDGGFPTRLTLGLGQVEFLASRVPTWSPDGHYISYVSRKSGDDEVWLWPSNGEPEFQLTRLGAQIHSMGWAPDSSSVVLSGNRYGSFDIYRAEVPSGVPVRLTKDSLYEVNPVFTPDGTHILYVRMDDKWEDHDIVMMTVDGSDSRVVVSDTDFFDYSYGRTFGHPHVSPDGASVLFRSQRSGHINIWKASPNGGEPEPLASDPAEQSDPVWSPDGQRVAYISNTNGTLSLMTVDAGGGEPRTLFSPQVGVCSAPQWSPDGVLISFLHGTPTTPEDLWVVPTENGRPPRQLTHSLPSGELDKRLVTPKKVAYESFDGLTINAYLYSPMDKERGRRYPGILFIHGGPTSQFLDTFQPYVQYFVQRGYVVLLPNVRGSSGYGKAFEELNDRDWGHGDLKDAIAGADYLKTLDYVDPDNMGITGTSYGGNMSFFAVGFAPGVFQAAVPMSGYADQPKLLHELELRHIKQNDHEFGPYEGNEEIWLRSSPIYSVKDATTPCFVLHGVGREPQSVASREFVEALKKEYKIVEYKTYPNDNYYVRSPENVRQMLLDVTDFFDRYLKA